MLQITVDQNPHQVPEGGTVLGALRQLGYEIPSLCHDARLVPHPVCRLCIVEVEGREHPVPSCSTALEDGMVIHTRSSRVEARRRESLTLLARRHSPELLASPDEHPFAHWLKAYGLEKELTGSNDATRTGRGPMGSSSPATSAS